MSSAEHLAAVEFDGGVTVAGIFRSPPGTYSTPELRRRQQTHFSQEGNGEFDDDYTHYCLSKASCPTWRYHEDMP
jgi:hypothetical protein